jgi:hypothetical protein
MEGGIVGLTCKTGSLVFAKRKSAAQFRKVWKLTALELTGAKDIKPYVDSLLCCPFFAPPSPGGPQRILLALFVDSANPDFFDDEVLQVIASACRGFVDLLESLHEGDMLRVLAGSGDGFPVPPKAQHANLVAELEKLGVEFVDATDEGWKKGLTFRTLRSVDLQSVSYQDLVG